MTQIKRQLTAQSQSTGAGNAMHMDGPDFKATLSKRALDSVNALAPLSELMKIFQNVYDKKTNPDGIISLGVAENALMHDELTEYFNKKIQCTPFTLTYGQGPGGTTFLRTALSKFMNRKFNPTFEIKPEHIQTGSGVGGVVDLVCHAIAEEGQGILIGRPIYTGFAVDLYGRAKTKLIPVSLLGVDPMGVEAVKLYEKELEKQKNKGIKVKGMILCNPHNPLGKCYTAETITAYARFCEAHQIHLISDEIYALSIYSTPQNTSAEPFTSVLSVPLDGVISKHLVHVLYGMSKDFCANGLRMGAIISPWNPMMLACVGAAGIFEWPSSFSDLAWTTILQDEEYLDGFIERNQKKLATHYDILVDWFKKMDIPYVGGSNAGFFVWVDLRRYLNKIKVPEDKLGEGEGNSNIPGAPKGAQQKDSILFKKMIKEGVYVGTAEMFFGEEHGWYRFSFSTTKQIMELGLGRMEKVLKSVDEESIEDGFEELKLEGPHDVPEMVGDVGLSSAN